LLSELNEESNENTDTVVPTKLPDPIDPGQFIYQQGYFIPYSNYSNQYSYNYSLQPTTNIQQTNHISSGNIITNEQQQQQHYQTPITSYPVYHPHPNFVQPNSPTAGTYTSSVPISNTQFIPQPIQTLPQPQSEYYISPEGRLYVRSPR